MNRHARFTARLQAAALSLAMLLLMSTQAHAEDGWMRVASARADNDVSLWTRHLSGQQMKQFRGETHAGASLEQALSLFLDMDATPGWLYRCQEAKILEKVGTNEYIVHLKFNAFWPLQDRDAVIRIVGTRHPGSGAVTLTGTALPDYLPARPDVVRVPAIAASFILEPVKDHKLRLEMTGHFDPGGVVPLWMANMVVTILPKHSLSMMSSILGKSYYTGARADAGRKALAEISATPTP